MSFEWYRRAKETWINKHPNVQVIRNRVSWFEFHLNRGKSFFNLVIDFVKLLLGGAAAVEIIPWLGFLKPHLLLISVALIPFFFMWSQVLDFLKWQETRTELDNERNEFVKDMRERVK